MESRNCQKIEVFQHYSAKVTKMEPTLRLTQVLKEKAEDIGLQAKDIAEYVTRQQTLDREERAVWIEAQKRQVEIRMAELQAEDKKRADELQAEDKKRADKIHMAERADEIKIQIAQIEAAIDQPRWIKNSRLTPSVRAPPGRGGHGNQLMYGPPRAGGVTLCCRFCTSDVKMFRFVASFH